MVRMPVLLLVEDDPADAHLIQRGLQKIELPARVVHLVNGDQAVDYMAGDDGFTDREAHPLPWLILLDIKLPRRSGLEVLQWIRDQDGPIASTPVVIFSSSSHSVDIHHAYQSGANSFLVKPETSSQLEGMLSLLKSYWFVHNRLPAAVN